MARSLRIAIVMNPFARKRLVGDHAHALASELLGRGHTVRGFGAPPGAIPRSGSMPTVDGGVAPDEGLGLLGYRPDLILAYDSLSPAAWHSARMASRLGAALVLVEGGQPALGRPLAGLKHFVGRRIWGRGVRRNTAAVVALDPVAKQDVVGRGFSESLVTVDRGGVDLTRFRPGLTSEIPARHGVRGRIILHLGRIEPGRGLELLVSAFAATVGRRDDWSLVFAGEGGASGHLRVTADRLGIGAHVHWIGKPRGEELPGLMGVSTLMVTPAESDDVSSSKILRAMASGLPVLAADVLRLEGLVGHDETGLVVASGDRNEWIAALQTASGAPERRKRWGLRARAIAEEQHGWPAATERLENILLRAAERREREREPDGVARTESA
ncbi:MAG: glycosyltransferase family 4 protein [bacterium]|nr:glycosyltransferase family 4 protein [bacterium]